jgi:phospholipase C
MTRRNFFRKAATAAGAASLSKLLAASVQRAAGIAPAANSTYLDAEHVVILMQENRSFDHCFGRLRGVRGFHDPRAVPLPNGHPVWLQTNRAGETYAPFRLDIKKSRATWLGSLPHSWTDQTDARSHGNHNGWLDAKVSGKHEYAHMPLTMGYYDREDIPFYYAFADAFTVCDQHFCSSLTGTTPNRLYLWTGTVRHNAQDTPCVRNSEVDYGVPAHWKTFPERLEDAAVSWKIYQNELSVDTGLDKDHEPWLANFTDNPIEFFEQFHVNAAVNRVPKPEELPASARELHRKAFTTNSTDSNYHEIETLRYRDGRRTREMFAPKGDVLHQFRADVQNGALPTVSWLVAPENFSDHPGAPWYGAWYVAESLNILTSNPELWKKTIFILTYDENDGYFDHVPPFVAPDPRDPQTGKTSASIDASADFLPIEQDATRTKPGHARGGPIGLGFRVPMIIASPWSRGGFVCSQVFDHTSVLQLLETIASRRAGKPIREDNISPWRRAICGDLSSAFHPADSALPDQLTYPSQPEQLAEIDKARYQPLPTGYRKLSHSDITGRTWKLGQESGVRPSTALPYKIHVTGKLSADRSQFEITLESKACGVPFHAYCRGLFGQQQKLRTRAYAVAAGESVAGAWALDGFESSVYDLHIHGPNGFYRAFAGTASDPPLDLHCEYAESTGDIELLASNQGDACVLQLTDNAYSARSQLISVAKNGQAITRLDLSGSHSWYDFTVRIVGNESYSRRFSGRVETGKSGFSDPAMA